MPETPRTHDKPQPRTHKELASARRAPILVLRPEHGAWICCRSIIHLSRQPESRATNPSAEHSKPFFLFILNRPALKPARPRSHKPSAQRSVGVYRFKGGLCCRRGCGCLIVASLWGRVEAGRVARGLLDLCNDPYDIVAAHASIHVNHTITIQLVRNTPSFAAVCDRPALFCMIRTNERLVSYSVIQHRCTYEYQRADQRKHLSNISANQLPHCCCCCCRCYGRESP